MKGRRMEDGEYENQNKYENHKNRYN
jgi:hypothetical protein